MQLTSAPVSNKHEKYITTSINFESSASGPALIDEEKRLFARPRCLEVCTGGHTLGLVSLVKDEEDKILSFFHLLKLLTVPHCTSHLKY